MELLPGDDEGSVDRSAPRPGRVSSYFLWITVLVPARDEVQRPVSATVVEIVVTRLVILGRSKRRAWSARHIHEADEVLWELHRTNAWS